METSYLCFTFEFVPQQATWHLSAWTTSLIRLFALSNVLLPFLSFHFHVVLLWCSGACLFFPHLHFFCSALSLTFLSILFDSILISVFLFLFCFDFFYSLCFAPYFSALLLSSVLFHIIVSTLFHFSSVLLQNSLEVVTDLNAFISLRLSFRSHTKHLYGTGCLYWVQTFVLVTTCENNGDIVNYLTLEVTFCLIVYLIIK